MKRRAFLKAVLGGTVLAPVAIKLLPTPITRVSGFGMAAVKAEGAPIVFDSVVGSSLKALWPGVKAWWEAAEKDCPAEYKDLFVK